MSKARINATDLQYNKVRLAEIDGYITATLDAIDDEIREKYQEGHNYINYNLQSSFDISSGSTKRLRQCIHSWIISDLTSSERDFIVYYYKNNDKYFINVRWVSLDEQNKIDHEKRMLEYYNEIPDKRKIDKRPASKKYEGLTSLLH